MLSLKFNSQQHCNTCTPKTPIANREVKQASVTNDSEEEMSEKKKEPLTAQNEQLIIPIEKEKNKSRAQKTYDCQAHSN